MQIVPRSMTDLHQYPILQDCIHASQALRKKFIEDGFSEEMIEVLSDMPATRRMVDWTLWEDSADFALIKHMFMSSIVQHRMALGSVLWAEKMQLEIVSITFVDVSAKFRKYYIARCEEVHEKELPEPMFPDEVWRPVASKDANEFFLFH
eukprot:188620-Amphidinium_carterae.1